MYQIKSEASSLALLQATVFKLSSANSLNNFQIHLNEKQYHFGISGVIRLKASENEQIYTTDS